MLFTRQLFTTRFFDQQQIQALFFGRTDCKNSPQSHIVKVYDAGLDESGVFHSAEWHVGDWSSDGIGRRSLGSSSGWRVLSFGLAES
ncbi:hypothetical protein TNCV_2705791 [Trichonephila clavipes]|nr:hypothetical protein TNCV_2705791 [Trichonephila clavipes]